MEAGEVSPFPIRTILDGGVKPIAILSALFEKMIHARSGSRIGDPDLGVNRSLIWPTP